MQPDYSIISQTAKGQALALLLYFVFAAVFVIALRLLEPKFIRRRGRRSSS